MPFDSLDDIRAFCRDLPGGDRRFADIAAQRQQNLTKPPGSLGRLEELAIWLAQWQARENPRLERVTIAVFAGNHGVAARGVSAYPQAVTAAMVGLILEGRASISALARSVGAQVQVIDVGVAAELAPHPLLNNAKVRSGTRNAAREPAMTATECAQALEVGAAAAQRAAEDGAEIIGLGEMGIGNTASASLLLHRLGPAPLDDCIGLGAGHDDEGLARKRRVLEAAAARTDAQDPFEVLRQFGGLEIAGMAGAALGAAALRRPVVVDGFISTAAVMVAARLQPRVLEFCIFAHSSAERGHRLMLRQLGAQPLLDLGMRLGEGTGAALALPILKSAAAMAREVASLAEVLGQR
jgi:nicotinate-nucleotide--dimethylbenzimidazole phosphoribosyltransferase